MKSLCYSSLLLTIVLLSACQPRMYFPERANTPGFQQVGEFKGTFSGKTQGQGGDSSKTIGGGFSPDVDLAYSITDHFAVLASYRSTLNRYINEGDLGNNPFFGNRNTFGGMFNGHYVEGGAGYYTAFGSEGRFEVFGGYGQGTIRREGSTNPQYNYSSQYHCFFVQPAIGFGNNVFNLMGGMNIRLQKYNNFSSTDPDLKYYISTTSSYSNTDVTGELFTFVQPFINMEVGYKYVRFNTQMGISKELTGGFIQGSFPFYWTFGATFNYAPRYFKKRPARVITHSEN